MATPQTQDPTARSAAFAPAADALWGPPHATVQPVPAPQPTWFDLNRVPVYAFGPDGPMQVPGHGVGGGLTWQMLRAEPDLTTGFAHIAAGGEFEPHWHTAPEIYHSLSDSLQTRVDDGPLQPFPSGTTLDIPSLSMHHTRSSSAGAGRFAYFIGDYRLREGANTPGWKNMVYEKPHDHVQARDTRDFAQPVLLGPDHGVTQSMTLAGVEGAFRARAVVDDPEHGFGEGELAAGARLPAHVRARPSMLIPVSGTAKATSGDIATTLDDATSVYLPAGAELALEAGPDAPFRFLLFVSKGGHREGAQARWVDDRADA